MHPIRPPLRGMATKGMGQWLGFTSFGLPQVEPAERIERMTRPGKPFFSSLQDGEAPGTMGLYSTGIAVQQTWQ